MKPGRGADATSGVDPAAVAWGGMSQNKSTGSRAGGAIIAFTILAGALIGAMHGQPSLGTVIGTATGVAISLALLIYDRRR